jgi:hypothetical protein
MTFSAILTGTEKCHTRDKLTLGPSTEICGLAFREAAGFTQFLRHVPELSGDSFDMSC